MTNTLKPLMGVDIAMDDTTKRALFCLALEALKNCVNTTTNRLQVDAAGVTITADILTVDIQALTGAPPNNKNLYDVYSAVAALRASATLDTLKSAVDTLAAGRNLKVNAVWRIAATGATGLLKDKGGALAHAEVQQLMFLPHGGQTEYVHFTLSGAATTNSPQIASPVAVPCNQAIADAIQVIPTAGTVYVTCFELIPRS